MAVNIGFGEEAAFDFLGEGVFENIHDILDDNELLEMVDTCVGVPGPLTPPVSAAAAPPPAFPPLTGRDGTRLVATSEEKNICDEVHISEDWLTNLLDDPNLNIDMPATATATIDTADSNDEYIVKGDSLFLSSSTVSVLNDGSGGSGVESGTSTSSSSCSNSVNNDADVVSLPPISPHATVLPPVPARARTKRPRPSAFTPHVPVARPRGRDTLVEYCPPPMKRRKKNYHPLAVATSAGESAAAAPRRCLHCRVQKTPQWRLGPMGPKTLCNACGMRYKSGRLFPEYRPAASPTLVPSVHSNSHKKVVEMRTKASEKETCAMSRKVSPAAKNCDLLLYIRNID